uniref:Mos1 transposase HTH domain-containing protein n=1 Tax=Salarias fasciatus TaxID=181472 RepID=A0A672HAL3_SALFA
MAEHITKRDQRASIRFCFLLGKTASETLTMVQEAYKDGALGRTQVFEWYGRFKRGEMSTEDQPRSGRPASSRPQEKIREVEAMVLADRRRTVREVSTLTGVPWSSCQEILSQDLGLRRVAAKMVPRILTPEQKAARADVCREILQHIEEDPGLLGKVIMADETWRHACDPETKQQSSQWRHPDSPQPKKARQSWSAVKAMLICFFDTTGVDHDIQVLRRLREAVRQKRPELWRDGEWWLHHDNAPAHRALCVMQFLVKNGMTLLPHPPYSPDLALCDFFSFPKNEERAEGAEICWKTRMQRCIQTSGDYFEGGLPKTDCSV